MIKIAPTKDYIVALESVAMTDIVLNMFIFFFISFSLLYTFKPDRLTKVELKLPESKSTVSLEGQEQVNIALTKDGKIYLGTALVDIKMLRRELGSLLEKDRSLPIVFRVDRRVRFHNVVKVLDVTNGLGVRRLSIAAVRDER